MASNTTVAHNWANQTGKYTKGSSFFYEGQLLYSYGYHFVVGAISEDGGTAILTNRTYSSSTNRHKSYARSAASHLNRIYCKSPESAIKGHHGTNIDAWAYSVGLLLQKDIAKCNLHKLVNDLEAALAPEIAYCAYFDIPLPAHYTEASAFVEQLKSNPKWFREQELEATKEARRIAADTKKFAENLAKFRAGEISYFSSSTQYLRLNGDNVCTSLGVCIKVREFMFHYNRLAHKENLVGTKVDDSYTILSVSDESVKIGCHRIGRDELDSIAQQIAKFVW